MRYAELLVFFFYIYESVFCSPKYITKSRNCVQDRHILLSILAKDLGGKDAGSGL